MLTARIVQPLGRFDRVDNVKRAVGQPVLPADDVFEALLAAAGSPWWKRRLMKAAVVVGGGAAYRHDQAQGPQIWR